MKKRRKNTARSQGGDLQDSFVRGFVSTGLLAVSNAGNRRQALRTALQGGTALWAASLAAGAVRRRSLPGMLGALAAGSAGLLLIGQLLPDTPSTPNPEEKIHG